MKAHDDVLPASVTGSTPADLESLFLAHYESVLRLVARVIRDRARAEELAVDVFLKWAHRRSPGSEIGPGWLYRVAARLAIDELRRSMRGSRYDRMIAALSRRPRTPEEVHTTAEAQQAVRTVLAALRRRDAEMLVLRSHGLAYGEMALALNINPASIGTLLGRAQRAFRAECVRRYGDR
ncbi:MAG: sigma-70 family RNA polymerase sigma factor [Acidobacteria bacterium]|nr:sigma-70 family RNA polymerase sigma factor [Acidobacteriota bacterium]